MKTYVKLSAFLLLIIFFPFINTDLDDDIKPIELTNEAVATISQQHVRSHYLNSSSQI